MPELQPPEGNLQMPGKDKEKGDARDGVHCQAEEGMISLTILQNKAPPDTR